MDVNTLIDPGAILPDLRANSKKQVLQELAGKAAELTGISEREIFETILGREKRGSTGGGNGIAIPHGKLGELDRHLARQRRQRRLGDRIGRSRERMDRMDRDRSDVDDSTLSTE